ncbi:MAG: 23S rRNA (uracil(1939)-C(5))-methyltransferase RlmD [Paludibacteraceae bacterium]|nr:23S rRNA (uracil(1939)-C(5))-methyltransferase RlmD [Paludibacteraceae bacterium]
MKKKNLPLIENIEITGVAAEGKAITRYNDCVVFVPWCVPGDVVDLQITKKKHNYMEARVEHFHKYSDKRTKAVCKHFGQCGGCKWQILPYEEQLRYKQQQIIDNLTRIGKIELPEISPIFGSKHIYEYRNKLEFTFSNKRWVSWDDIHAAGGIDKVEKGNGLGFHITDCFDKVLDIEQCHLMPDINNQIRNFIREYAVNNQLTFFDLRQQTGILRTIIIRQNSKGEVMLIVVFGENISADISMPLMNAIHNQFPQIVSLLYVINTKANDTINDLDVNVFFGKDYIIEQMEDLQFKVGPKSFYQTNTQQAYELYKITREFALEGLNNDSKPLIYDLYTGTGTIANFVARHAKQVIGIEYVPEAIEDAKVNAQLNKLDNTLFFAGDMKNILNTDFIVKYGRPDIIITDPPRAGMHEDVINTILFAAPEKIVYVSCNSATQARDIALLDPAYQVKHVQPVDMFPHTHHCENVVLLQKR